LIQLWDASRKNEKLRAISDQYFFIEIQIEQGMEALQKLLIDTAYDVDAELTEYEFAPSWIDAFKYVAKELPKQIRFSFPPV
jgi:hypothetical protein